MDNAPPQAKHALKADLCAVQEAVVNGFKSKTAKNKDTHWGIWIRFCGTLGVDPFLRDVADPIPILQVFAHCHRDGRVAPSNKSV